MKEPQNLRKRIMPQPHRICVFAAVVAAVCSCLSAATAKSIRALLVTGGCCHPYAEQAAISRVGSRCKPRRRNIRS
jgi:hypothetical protein